ncbi:hypothetical protein Tco_0128667 [Tanacetum coccineum]
MGEVDIDTLTMEQYMDLTRGNNGPGMEYMTFEAERHGNKRVRDEKCTKEIFQKLQRSSLMPESDNTPLASKRASSLTNVQSLASQRLWSLRK